MNWFIADVKQTGLSQDEVFRVNAIYTDLLRYLIREFRIILHDLNL